MDEKECNYDFYDTFKPLMRDYLVKNPANMESWEIARNFSLLSSLLMGSMFATEAQVDEMLANAKAVIRMNYMTIYGKDWPYDD